MKIDHTHRIDIGSSPDLSQMKPLNFLHNLDPKTRKLDFSDFADFWPTCLKRWCWCITWCLTFFLPFFQKIRFLVCIYLEGVGSPYSRDLVVTLTVQDPRTMGFWRLLNMSEPDSRFSGFLTKSAFPQASRNHWYQHNWSRHVGQKNRQNLKNHIFEFLCLNCVESSGLSFGIGLGSIRGLSEELKWFSWTSFFSASLFS